MSLTLDEFFELWCNGDLEIVSMTENVDKGSVEVEAILVHPINYVMIEGKFEV